MKIKRDDTVLVISGKDRGRKGKVIRVLPEQNKVVVEGLNLRKKHVRAKRAGEKGQVVQILAPFSASNVALVCPACSKATRIGNKVEGNRKYRLCKKCGANL